MLPGRISIGRPSCSSGRRYIRIEVSDESSGIRIIEVEMDLDAFAEALTGLLSPCLHDMDTDSTERVSNYVGKVVRAETVRVPFTYLYSQKEEMETDADRIVADLKERLGCVEVARRDLFNPHRRFSDGVQSVTVWYYDDPVTK